MWKANEISEDVILMRCCATVFLSIILLILCSSIAPVSASGDDAASLVAQGNALLGTKNYTEALDAFNQAIALDRNNFDAWNGKADTLNRAGNFNLALAASDTALALEPKNPQGWINRGYILYNLGRYDDELNAYETAISIDPNNADAWFNKGYSLAGMKRYDEALAAFDRVQAIRPDYPNLAQNRKIAEQLKATQAPAYVQYWPVIAGAIIVIAAIAAFAIYRKRTGYGGDTPEKENRQSRRRKERQN